MFFFLYFWKLFYLRDHNENKVYWLLCVIPAKKTQFVFIYIYIYIYISERLSNNSSNEEIFNASKYEYETALKNSGYHQTKLIFSKKEQGKQKRIRKRNIIWFNPPFSRNVTTNVAKRFFNLLDIHFPKLNKLRKIFNRNTVKVSYFCTENLSSIVKTHNKKVTNEKITPRD